MPCLRNIASHSIGSGRERFRIEGWFQCKDCFQDGRRGKDAWRKTEPSEHRETGATRRDEIKWEQNFSGIERFGIYYWGGEVR